MTTRDRPVIEVTEEMISAGASAVADLRYYQGFEPSSEELAEAAYRAMAPLAVPCMCQANRD